MQRPEVGGAQALTQGPDIVKRNWWIFSFTIGLLASLGIGYRVFSQAYEVQRAEISQHLTTLVEREKFLVAGQSANLSREYLNFANEMREKLAYGDELIHAQNRPGFTYLEGFARFTGGKKRIEEALGSEDVPADPYPETYLSGFEQMEEAIRSGNSDIPDVDGSDFERFKAVAASQIPSPDVTGLMKRYRIEYTTENGQIVPRQADDEKLRQIGMYSVSADTLAQPASGAEDASAPGVEPTPGDSNLRVLKLGAPISEPQLLFMANRSRMYDDLDRIYMSLSHRLTELNRPEYAWQFYGIVVTDQEVIGGIYRLPSLLKRTMDARRDHLQSFATFMADSTDSNSGALKTAAETYTRHLKTLERELDAAVLAARAALSRRPELQRFYESEVDKLQQKREELADRKVRMASSSDLESEAVKSYREKETAEHEARALNIQRRVENMERALETLVLFPQFMTDAIDGEQAYMPVEEIRAILEPEPNMLNRLVNKVVEQMGRQQRQEYLSGLRTVWLTDLIVLRARIARLLGDGRTADGILSQNNLRLGTIEKAYARVRVGIDEALKPFEKDKLHDSGIASEYEAESESVRDIGEMGKNLAFLQDAVAKARNISKDTSRLSRAEQSRWEAMVDLLTMMRNSLVNASFESSELRYQIVLGQLQKLTGSERPIVSIRAARYYGQQHRNWVAQTQNWLAAGAMGSAPAHPLNQIDYENERELQTLREWLVLEHDYRRYRDEALASYKQFLNDSDSSIVERAKFGIISLELDDMLYDFDWKWRQGFGVDASIGTNRYGVYAYAEPTNPVFSASEMQKMRAAGVTALSPYEGVWESSDEARRRHSKGPEGRRLEVLDLYLSDMRKMTPSQNPELYIAVWFRSGQLTELRQAISYRQFSTGGKEDYLGDLPKAINEFYVPVLKTRIGVTNDDFTLNKYIPLAIHFNRVTSKLQRWLDDVDTTKRTDLDALFLAIAPASSRTEDGQEEISSFYEDYFRNIQKRAPGLVELADAVYDFNFRLGELAEARARLTLTSENNVEEARQAAARSRLLARDFYRVAGGALEGKFKESPMAEGAADANSRMGEAYFRSRDYVKAISSWNFYLDARLKPDQEAHLAIPFYITNRIGEAYMELGIYEGATMLAAERLQNDVLIRQEKDYQTLTIDGAMPAFRWVIGKTHALLKEKGEGAYVQNRLPPGVLQSFVNMAKAQIELGRLSSADVAKATGLYQGAIDLLQRDLINPGMFPAPIVNFTHSMVWRDAKFMIGSAELELARLARLETTTDDAARQQLEREFEQRLMRASDAFLEIARRWQNPVDRAAYEATVNRGVSYADAMIEAGESKAAAFEDDLYYLSTLNSARVEWLRAVYHPDRDSQVVLDALNRAEGKLEFLQGKLNRLVGDQERRVDDDVLTFPELRREVDFMIGDVVYLHARTLRNRLNAGVSSVTKADVRSLYNDAIRYYELATSLHPNSYLAAWAYTQRLNAHRALAEPSLSEPEESEQHAKLTMRLLDASGTFLSGLPDEAFALAPSNMSRQTFEDFFVWFRSFYPPAANTQPN